jgi:hypothetical protein
MTTAERVAALEAERRTGMPRWRVPVSPPDTITQRRLDVDNYNRTRTYANGTKAA